LRPIRKLQEISRAEFFEFFMLQHVVLTKNICEFPDAIRDEISLNKIYCCVTFLNITRQRQKL